MHHHQQHPPSPHHLHHVPPPSAIGNQNNNYLISYPSTTTPSSSTLSEQVNQHQQHHQQHQQYIFDHHDQHHNQQITTLMDNQYHNIQQGLSSLLQQREQFLLQQHHYHNLNVNQWQVQEKTIHHTLEMITLQKQKLQKKLKKLKTDVYRMHNIDKTNKMNHQIGGKPRQMNPPPQPMSLSSQQVLATPLSLLLDDPSIGDSQNPSLAPQVQTRDSSSIIRNPQSNSVVVKKKTIHSVNLTSNSTTTSAAPYSLALDATPEMTMPSTIRASSKKQTASSSSTFQATNSSVVFTNNPSF